MIFISVRIVHSIDSELPKFFDCCVLCVLKLYVFRRLWFIDNFFLFHMMPWATCSCTIQSRRRYTCVYIYIFIPKITFPIHMHCSVWAKNWHQENNKNNRTHIYTHLYEEDTQIHLLGRLFVNKISHLRFPQIFRGQKNNKKCSTMLKDWKFQLVSGWFGRFLFFFQIFWKYWSKFVHDWFYWNKISMNCNYWHNKSSLARWC